MVVIEAPLHLDSVLVEISMFVPTPSNQILFQGPLPLLFFTPFTFSIFLQVTFNPKHPIPPQFTRNCYANVNRPLGFPQSHFPSAAVGVGVGVVGESNTAGLQIKSNLSLYVSFSPTAICHPLGSQWGERCRFKKKKKSLCKFCISFVILNFSAFYHVLACAFV